MPPQPPQTAASTGLIIRRAIGHSLVARVAGPRIEAFAAVPSHDPGGVGHLYRGRVVRVVDALQAAFVDIGAGRPAFLTAGDVSVVHAKDGEAIAPGEPAPIRRLLFEGQPLLVQVRRTPQADKGARVTTRVALSGRLWVVTADTPAGSVSSRIEVPAERERLRAIAEALATRYRVALVARTAAQGVAEGALEQEVAALAGQLEQVAAQAQRERAPRWLSADRPALAAYLLAHWRHGDSALYADDDATAHVAAAALGDVEGAQAVVPQRLTAWRGADSEAAFAGALTKALAATVHLPGGGTLIFGHSPALCAIDVNSGQGSGHAKANRKNKRGALCDVNLEAAKVAGEQIVLRNIGGIVVIDFIDLGDEAHRHQVADALKAALHGDKEKTYVSRMSELGLVQLTRRQRHPPLHVQLNEHCDACHTAHARPAAWYVGTVALWATQALLGRTSSAMLLIQCHPEVAAALWGDGCAWLDAIAAAHNTCLVPLAREGWPRERFELLDASEPGDRYPGKL